MITNEGARRIDPPSGVMTASREVAGKPSHSAPNTRLTSSGYLFSFLFFQYLVPAMSADAMSPLSVIWYTAMPLTNPV